MCVFYSDTPTLLRNVTIHLWELVFCLFFSSADFKHWVNICQVIKKFILDNWINEVFTEPVKRTSLFQPEPGASLDQQIIWLAACKQEPSSNPMVPWGWTLWKTHAAASFFLSSWKTKQKKQYYMGAAMPARTHLKDSGSVTGMLSGTFPRYPSATSGVPPLDPPQHTHTHSVPSGIESLW